MSLLEQLSFSENQKRGVLILGLIIVLAMGGWALWNVLRPEVQNIPFGLESDVDSLRQIAETPEFFVDVNGADSSEFTRLRGIGPVLASRIVRFREKAGGFDSIQQVAATYGLSGETFDYIVPYLRLDSALLVAYRQQLPHESPATPARKLDLNEASASELERLPGIGPVLSKRIVKYRNSLGGFQSVDDLSEVYGLPPETLIKIRPLLTLQSAVAEQDEGPDLIFPIDLNTSDEQALARIPGLGEREAQRIVKFRELLGFYYQTDQLSQVYGLDSEQVTKLSPYLKIGDLSMFPRWDLNEADSRQLGYLGHINGATADAIIQYRNQIGEFESWDEVKLIPGLSPEAFSELKIYFKI